MFKELQLRYPMFFHYINELEHEDGWIPIVESLAQEISALNKPVFATQVKQKFGTLRVYWSSFEDLEPEIVTTIDNLVHSAELKSSTTCEQCGAPGTLINPGGYYHTACKDHQ